MDLPKKTSLPVVSRMVDNPKEEEARVDSYVVVRYAVDFFTDTRKVVGKDRLSALLRCLRAIVESDCIRRERIIRTYPDGFDILVLFSGRRELDGRIGGWARRFQKILKLLGASNVVSLSAGVGGAMDAFEPSRLEKSMNQAVFARHFGRLERNPFVRYYVDEDYQALRRQRRLEAQLCSAWRENQLQVYLQPQYDLDGRKIVGAEALVRWYHPERGLIMPDEFIPLLERNRCIMRLDFWMLEQCCKILQGWNARGRRGFPLSVNFSKMDAIREDFVPRFVSITEKYGVSPDQLCLEWTESAFSNQDGQVTRIAEQLHAKGYRIAMDDFGTGYSSLSLLADLPVDVVKWDRKFMDFQEDNRHRRSFLNQMMGISKSLKYTVIAEGVEYPWQAALLKQIGCKYAQGFLFGRPVPWRACEKAIGLES